MPRKKPIMVRVARDDERPDPRSKFKVEYIGIAARLAAHGMSNDRVAMYLGVAPRTFDDWLARHPKLREAMVIPKEIADGLVVMSLFDLARGYDYYEEEAKVINGEIVKV